MREKPKLKLDWCSHEAAKYACEHWHYSKTIPPPPTLKIAVYEQEKYIGAVIFSRGASSNLFKPFNLKNTDGCELTRVALYKHQTPVSKILSIAIKMLKKSNPKLKIIISFADPYEGHCGGIYQAGNWIYTGTSSISCFFLDKEGKKYHSRQVSEKGFNIQFGMKRICKKPSQLKKIIVPGKHRYIMVLDKTILNEILLYKKTYPKRVSSKENVAVSDQGTEGGVIPTDTLQGKLNA